MLTGFVHVRRAAIATVTALSFSMFSGATALARSPAYGEPGLPAPTSLAIQVEPGEAVAAPAPKVDVPEQVPAQQAVSPAKLTLSVLGVVGLVLLAALIVVGIAVWDLTTNNE